MEGVPALMDDLALILCSAALVTIIFKKLKQPLVLGYIVAGFLVSTHMPYTSSVINEEDISTWGNIGVTFLLFSLGLEFSFKKIAKMGISPIIAAVLIVFCMMVLGIFVGHVFGWGDMDCIFLGGMLAMSSTTIIYKAFDDMNLQNQGFTSMVMSVLILEDILAIVLMVMLSTFAGEGEFDGGKVLESVLSIVYYVVIWFLLGIFLIPLLLKKLKNILNEEMLLILSLALCLTMSIISTEVGFSSAFGAFIMGSILAETLEVEKIEKVFTPVKNLFGAIFFVSVGMLVDPAIIVEYAVPVVVLVLTIILGHVVFSSFAYFISGQSLKNAMKCGFSMTQIGEFAFIIATLGLSLNVISPFIYPVVVAVSVITTFLTPYMMKLATPAYDKLEAVLPDKWVNVLNTLTVSSISDGEKKDNAWRKYIFHILKKVGIHSIICLAISLFMLNVAHPFLDDYIPAPYDTIVDVVLTLAMMSPFLRLMAMSNIQDETFQYLWNSTTLNRPPLIFIVILRFIVPMLFVFFVVSDLSNLFGVSVLVSIACVVIFIIAMSKGVLNRGKKLEDIFINNLNAREVQAEQRQQKRKFSDKRLFHRDIHIAKIMMPNNSNWNGMSLHDLHFGSRYGIHISTVERGNMVKNIPDGNTVLFPGDMLHVIGTDQQLAEFQKALNTNTIVFNEESAQEMKLVQLRLSDKCPFVGKSLADSGLRNKYRCMALGLEEGLDQLTDISATRIFQSGDIVWFVGEKDKIKTLESIV